MASIVSSTYTLGHAQRNGTRYVTETHVWDSGLPSTVVEYGPVLDTTDYQAVANARAVQLMEQAAQAEFEALLNE